MTKDEIQRRLDSAEKQMIGLQDEIANLKAKLDEVQDGEIPDFPVFENGQEYWYSDDFFTTNMGCSTGIPYQDYNMFNKKETAQEFAKKCKLIAMMLHCKWYLDRDYVPDWESDTDSEKCYVIFDHCVNKFQVRTRFAEEGVEVYFSTEENAQKCADWLNKHWR